MGTAVSKAGPGKDPKNTPTITKVSNGVIRDDATLSSAAVCVREMKARVEVRFPGEWESEGPHRTCCRPVRYCYTLTTSSNTVYTAIK